MDNLINQPIEDRETNQLCLCIHMHENHILHLRQDLQSIYDNYLINQKKDYDVYVEKNGTPPIVFDDYPQYFLNSLCIQNRLILDNKVVEKWKRELEEFRKQLRGRSWVYTVDGDVSVGDC